LFLYPHSITGVLASRDRNVIKRNMAALPAYSFILGLLALLGYMAIKAKVVPVGADPKAGVAGDSNTIVPLLFHEMFPSWFAGIAFAAIGIGALVPAAIMSIAAANLWTRNIYKAYLRRDATPRQEAAQAKIASLVVKLGAVLFIIAIDPQFSIDLQLIGGVIILQTLPAVAIALYTRWLHRWALVAGWVVGMGYGMYLLYLIPNPNAGRAHFGGSALALDKLTLFGWHPFTGSPVQIYVGFVALTLNLLVAVLGTLVLRARNVAEGADATSPADYHADEGSERLKPVADVSVEPAR
ncbi:MAG: sodium:solute symporter family transporter, partial [Pseudonocardia sp.]